MKANIFKELLKYASFKEKEPKENKFTGSLAFLLKENKNLRIRFIKYLVKLHQDKYKKIRLPRILPSSLEVSSQSSHQRTDLEVPQGRNQIDIEIGDSDRFGIFIENKIGAGKGRMQDIRYRRTLDEKYGKGKGMLVFISLSGALDIDKKVKPIQLRWADVYDVFKKHLLTERNKINLYLLRGFLDYMKEENMAPFPGFNKKDIKGRQWLESYLLLNKFEGFYGRLRGVLVDRGYKLSSIERKDNAILFRAEPPVVVNNKSRLRKWKRNWSRLYFGADLYYRENYGERFEDAYEEGIYPYVHVYTRHPFRNIARFSRRLTRNRFYFYEGNKEFCNDEIPLSKIIGKETDPKKQEKRIMAFYLKALEAIEKTGVFRQLYR